MNLESPTVLKTYSKKKTIKSKKQSKLEESAKEQENIATDSQQEKLFSPSETLIEESDKEHRVIDWIEKLPDVDKFSHYQKPLDDLQGNSRFFILFLTEISCFCITRLPVEMMILNCVLKF